MSNKVTQGSLFDDDDTVQGNTVRHPKKMVIENRQSIVQGTEEGSPAEVVMIE